jgi:hypothetical protein
MLGANGPHHTPSVAIRCTELEGVVLERADEPDFVLLAVNISLMRATVPTQELRTPLPNLNLGTRHTLSDWRLPWTRWI